MPPALNTEIKKIDHDMQVTQQARADIKAGKPLPLFLYRLHFASVFEEKDGFDIAIANPPYVRHEKVPQATLAALKGAYPNVQSGMADLYVYFYARALQLLHDGGTLSFISSNKFFKAGYGKGLRETLATQTSLRTIIDFGDFPVFDAAAYPCVVIADKGKPTGGHTYRGLTAGNDIELDKLEDVIAASAQCVAQTDAIHPPVGSASTLVLAGKLMRQGTRLGALNGVHIYYGIKTGLNSVFIVDDEVRSRILAEHAGSEAIIKPVLLGRDVGRYELHPRGQWLIFTRRGINIERFPAVERYLRKYYAQLRPKQPGESGPGRKPGPYEWYEIQDSVDYYRVFESTKIVYRDIAAEAQFCFDTTGAYIETSLFCIAPAPRFLTAFLNSTLLDFLLMHVAPTVRGGFYRYKKEYVQELPILEPTPAAKRRLEELVDGLQAVGGQGPRAEEMEREVDEIVHRTYGLTKDEIAEIERWHAERRAMLGAGKRGRAQVEDHEEAEESGDEIAE